MAYSITFALQQALFKRLSEALTVTVYDYVPQDSAYPYVRLGDENTTNADFLNSKMETVFQMLSIYSAHKGQKEVREIIDQIYEAMHRTSLDIGDGEAFEVLVTRHRVTQDVDEMTYMGDVTLQIRVHRPPVSLPTYIIQNGRLR